MHGRFVFYLRSEDQISVTSAKKSRVGGIVKSSFSIKAADFPAARNRRGDFYWKLFITCLFLIWAFVFITRSSHVGIDGKRYFALFDDAYISMRYGWNLSHGNGLVWNVGERVEGYTNLLMTLYMSLVTLIFNKRISVLVIQISGVVLVIGTAYVTSRVFVLISRSSSHRIRSIYGLASYAFCLAYYPLLFWSLMGMETGLLSFLISLAYYNMLIFAKQASKKHLWIGSCFFGLASITRPDAIIFVIPIFLYFLIGSIKEEKWIGVKCVLFASSIVLLFPLLQLFFRWQYYGVLVPNTYILKVSGIPLDIRLQNGLIFIEPFLESTLLLIGFMTIGAFGRESHVERVLLFVCMIAVMYQIWTGGEPWFYWRLLTPAIPFALVLCMLGAQRFFSWSDKAISRVRFGNQVLFLAGLFLILVALLADQFGGFPGFGLFEKVSIQIGLILITRIILVNSSSVLVNTTDNILRFAIIATAIALIFSNFEFLKEMLFQEPAYTTVEHAATVDYSIIISSVTYDDASIGVAWAGAIPYYTGLYSVDFLGKTDPYIANLLPKIGEGEPNWGGLLTVPGHNKYDLEYSIATLQPTIIQLVQWGSQDLSDWALDHYELIYVEDFDIFALRGSEQINWDILLQHR